MRRRARGVQGRGSPSGFSHGDGAAAEAGSGPSANRFSRGDLGLARVEPELEEAAQLLTTDPHEAPRPTRLQLDDPHLCIARAVAAEVALLLA